MFIIFGRIPRTLIPILLFVIFISLFVFVPQGNDLISAKGDYYLGQAISLLFIVCLFIDFSRYIRNKKQRRNEHKI